MEPSKNLQKPYLQEDKSIHESEENTQKSQKGRGNIVPAGREQSTGIGDGTVGKDSI